MKTSEISTLFPATAMPDPDWWHALWPDPLGTVHALGIHSGMAVLDLCCGDGYFTAAIAECVGQYPVYGVDLDETMLIAANTTCAEFPQCQWIQGDAMQLKALLPRTVDYCLMANTFHGVPNQTALASSVAEILKPGGFFTVVNWHVLPREETPVLGQARGPRNELRMTPEQVRAAVEPAGYRLHQLVDLPPYHYGAIFQSGR